MYRSHLEEGEGATAEVLVGDASAPQALEREPTLLAAMAMLQFTSPTHLA